VAVNLTDIPASFQEGEEVSLEALKERRVLNPTGQDQKLLFKMLGDGELDFKVKFKAGAVSTSAKEKLESPGYVLSYRSWMSYFVRQFILHFL
jgi:large subunit ribosomal protein L15